MEYLAHISEGGVEQKARDHLEQTGKIAGEFARSFEEEPYVREIGRGHDIGKYSESFQYRVRGSTIRVDHSTAGAVEFWKKQMPIAALCTAGHHTGIPSLGSRIDGEDCPTLMGRLKKKLKDYSAYENEITIHKVNETYIQNNFDAMLMTRFMFSALADADFLDTEQAMADGRPIPRGEYETIQVLAEKVEKKVQAFLDPKKALTPVNMKRCELLRSCVDMGKYPSGLYTYTAPTGSGKTFSSLAFAMKQVVSQGKDRIIYVVPYTSIIDQNAKEFRKILGEQNVLEHHSNVSFDGDENSQEKEERWRLAAENWDKPVVVTTSEQFFESLFSNRTSKCRKLHNIANSVVIFDEAQMLPVSLLKPCVMAIEALVRLFHVTAVLCTATQPALEMFWKDLGLRPTEISPDVKGIYCFFQRVRYQHIGKQSKEEIAAQMSQRKQVLTVVSTRKKAKELFELLPAEGSYHLSTLMYPVHRSDILEEIKQRLKEKKVCRVVSTSLIEAGVDVDFPVLFREEAGLDSIIQAAGRCNREGNLPVPGEVFIYESDEKLPDSMKQNVVIFHEIQTQFPDISSPEAIHAYFDSLYHLKDEELDEKEIIKATNQGIRGCMLPFVQIAERFRMIDTQTADILIPTQKNQELVEEIRAGEINRKVMRQVGPYIIHVYPQHFQKLWEAGDIELVQKDFAILINPKIYSENTGISLEGDFGKGLFT